MAESIQSIHRASQIMEAIANHNNSISLTELSKIVDLHKSTVHRILGTLIEIGYVQQNQANSHYELTIKLFEIGSSVIRNNNLTTLAKPYLRQLRDLSGEVVHLVVPDANEIVYIDKVESLHTLRMHSYVGKRSPMYCTAVGKAILSHQNREKIEAYWRTITPVKHTANTIIDLDAFIEELSKIKASGISYDNEEHEKDIRCIGTTLHSFSGEVVAAISISGPVQRMTDAHIDKLIPELLRVKQEISRELGRF
ncbi:MAG TPA: IclR family transcriptional regulator [Clostridiales bacterium UBA8960]|nr:IclR family transcriptional regulator [Clostridiales bacterium UBA8960]